MTSVRTGSHEFNLASRRAEESAARRFQAVQWLQSVVGQLGIPNQPSEKEFISCLRNGMILCYAINKIHPGAVSKVVETYSYQNGEYQLPPAYQYFENVKNFLVALEQLRLPGFEASDLEKDNLESGSVTKVVDCVLGLKGYHECKITSSGNGFYKHVKTPTFPLSATKTHPPSASKTSRHLDMSSVRDRNDGTDGESDKLKVIAKLIADHMFNSKEYIDENLFSLDNGSEISRANFERIISRFPELHSVFKDFLKEGTMKSSDLKSMPLEELPVHEVDQSNRSLHKRLLKTQEKELADLKTLFIETKQDFKDLQVHLQRDLMELGNQMQEMTSAAQGYYKVVEENRKLYNMVQDLKGNIRVFCRVRPIFNGDMKGVIDYIGKDGSLIVVDPSKILKDGRKTFQFNQVFGPTATQDDVFKETEPLIRSVMDGYNVCIFAYGQTGSGKTYTMSGPPGKSATEMGINYLALSDLFLICDKRKDMMTYEIFVQMVEIYNEQVRDLLAENSSCTKLDIRTCSSEDNGLSLPNATMHSVNSTKDVLQLMEAGELNRAVSSTSMNNRSSRSHSILMVHVRGKDTSGGTLRSCLHLVDLAGSERVDKSEVTGDRLKEAQYINKSLSCLGDVISALAQKNSHIPYRNSKLTLLLQDSLGGQAKTLMFAHLSPEEDSFGETISTLKFAQRVSTVELGAARAHKETREVMHLKEQIDNLKKALVTEEGNNVSYSGAKELKSPIIRPMAMTDITPPPRPRRLSIENCNNTKANVEDRRGIKSPLASTERTPPPPPPRPRRLSVENCSKAKANLEDRKGIKSPMATTERTPPPPPPPRPRRLSVENCSNAKANLEDRKGVKSLMATTERTSPPPPPPRPRRLSVENCSHTKANLEDMKGIKSPMATTERTPPPRPRRLSVENCKHAKANLEDRKGVKSPLASRRAQRLSLEVPKSCKNEENSEGDPTMEVQQLKIPRSPISYSQNGAEKVDGRTSIPQLQPLQTPVKGASKNEIQFISVDSKTSGKGSHIRKSLRTIGKLIIGSEKRKENIPAALRSPLGVSHGCKHSKSPDTSNAKTLRRQSLTGVLPPESERSRRSSIEGKPIENGVSGARNVKTPPPMRSPTKIGKRWA